MNARLFKTIIMIIIKTSSRNCINLKRERGITKSSTVSSRLDIFSVLIFTRSIFGETLTLLVAVKR